MTVLELAQTLKGDTTWQVRQALAHFLRCFQDSHKFLFSTQQADSTLKTVAKMLSDGRQSRGISGSNVDPDGNPRSNPV